MDWLIGGSEIVGGVALMAAMAATVFVLRPREGLQERRVVSFPGAWIVVGMLMTVWFGASLALIAIGSGVLR